MSSDLVLPIVALTLFQVKHLICDFCLQTPFQYLNKGIYAHPGGIVHAGIHVIGSLAPVLLLTDTAWLAASTLAAEFIVHYHVDWLKEQINRRLGISYDSALYWAAFGADQFLHQMTYIVIVVVLLRAAGV